MGGNEILNASFTPLAIMLWEDEGLNTEGLNQSCHTDTQWAKRQWRIYRYIIIASSVIGIILTGHVLATILAKNSFRSVPNMFHVNIFISNLCIMLLGIAFEFPVLLGAGWSV